MLLQHYELSKFQATVQTKNNKLHTERINIL